MKISASFTLLLSLLFCNLNVAQSQSAYLRSTAGIPWNNATNEASMDQVFGVGNWSDLRFETVNVANLLATHNLIFLDGSDRGANELETFLTTNIASFENWVNSGGNLFLNAAPNEGNGMNYGFGGTILSYGNNNTGTATSTDISHPIFNGPFLPVLADWSGNSFAHATVSGTGLDTLIVNASNAANVVVALKQWGAGRVIFGGMTTTNFHNPQPQATNLRNNILEYLKFNPVPLDAGIVSIDSPTVFCAGMHNVSVTLANLGLDTIFDVTVNWEFNGVTETPISYMTPLDTIGSGNNTVPVLLGSKNFVAGQVYTIKAWTSDPNGMADTVNFNDTSSVVVSPGLTGTYTIGGLSPDFNTFSEAVNTLNTFGVCGPVTFDVRNGTYNEQIKLDQITSVDSTNNITFQSESGDSSLVILSFFSSQSSSNYTVQLDGTDWVTFKGMTIEATGTSYSHAVSMTNEANHNTFENNIIRSISTTSTSTNYVNFYFNGTFVNEHNTINNNVFQNGSYGIYYQGNYNNANYISGTEIVNNTFANQYRWAIYLYYHNAPEVSQNKISTSSFYTAYRGIYMVQTYFGAMVNRNKITGSIGDIGIYLDAVYGTAAAPCFISNNFVQIGGTNTSFGLYSSSGSYQNILNNTIHLTNTSTNSRAYYDINGSNKIVLNNIFTNSGGGFAYYVNSTGAISNSDFNNLYTSGPILGYWLGNRTDLADWKAASSLDLASLSVNPNFVSPDNYVVTEISLNDVAFNSPLVTEDIEGESRSMTPDIGCDEWSPPSLDAGLSAFVNPVAPFPEGSQTISVLLKNNGLDTLFSADIDWEVDGVGQTTFNWTGALASADTTSIDIGSQVFTVGQGYDLKAWVFNPNNGVDPVPTNDTVLVNDLYPALGGEYTIGGASPDFNTFSDANTALEFGGLIDSVVFNVRNGTYTEQLSIPEIIGVDSMNNVVFQSESGDSTQVILTFSANSSNNYTLRFNGADWVTFSKMTLQATNTTYGRVVEVTNNSNHICLENNVLNGVAINTTSNTRTIIYSTSSYVNEYFKLKNNRILNGSYGLNYSANSSHVSGTEITGNYFDNQYTYAIFLDEHNTPIINDNTIQCNSPYSSYAGIYSNDSNLGGEVRRNRIYGNTRGAGIQLFDMFGNSSNQAWITNNFVEIGAGQGNTVVTGINVSNGSYQQFHYNTVNITSTNVSSRAIYTSSGSNRFFSNNIWANTGGGLTSYTNSTNATVFSNFNDLYTTGPNLLYWGGTFWPTLEAWQNGGNTQEGNSISENPFFLNSFDYKVAQSALNGAANPLSTVIIDIENESRDTLSPDIGADEFLLPPLDAGITAINPPSTPFPLGKQLMDVVLKNHGADTLQSVDINWTINGTVQTPISWTGTLLSADTLILPLDSIDFLIGQGVDIVSWTSNPNGMSDVVAINDTSKVNDLYGALNGVYTIGGLSPDFTDFSTAVNVLNLGGVVGPVTFNARDGIYTEQLSINEIVGVDSLNNVLFQSESGDSSLVTLTFNANSSANYTLRLNGADWLTFKDLTLAASNSVYQRVVELINGSNHISLQNNRIEGVNTNSTSNTRALVYIPSATVNEYFQMKNNHLESGGYGLLFEANYNGALFASGTEIVNNFFDNQFTYGIYIYNQNNPLVTRNKVITNSSYTGFRGIYLLNTYFGTTVTENVINGQLGGIGMMLDDVYGTINEPCLIANNFVQVGGTGTVQGIYCDYGNYHKIYHNAVHLTNTGVNSYAYFNRYGSSKEVLNNIFANSGAGRVYYSNTNAIAQSNFNDLYTTGATLGYYSGSTYSDLSAWQIGTSKDTNSVAVDPVFLSDTNLHVLNVVLDKLGTPVPEVTTDIDGDFRDPAKPDIGADEFSTAANDAGVVSIDSPVMPFAADIQPINVTLLNNGLDTLQNVTLNWEVNGVVQAPFNWAGVLLSGQTLDSVNLGNFTFEVDTAYTIRAWTSDPNGLTDPENFNDTSAVNDLYAALSGTYTLGGMSPDFPNFQAATTSLNNGGVIGPVIFNVRSGTYDEQLNFLEILGTNATNTVTFQSEVGDSSQVIIATAAATNVDNYVLKLDGTDWFRFKNMTFQNTNASYLRVVFLSNAAKNNEFHNNEFITSNVNSTSTSYAVVYSNSGDDDNTVFRYNRFIEGSYGLFLYGIGSTVLEEGTIIEHNSFEGQYYMGIRLFYHDAPQVSYNTFFSNNTIYCCSYFGIYSDFSTNDYRFIGNYFYDLSSGYGLYITNSNGTSLRRGLIANNFIATGQGNGNAAYGIYSNNSSFQDVYHNSININSNSTSSRAFYLNSSNVRIRNNIFASVNRGYAYFKNSGAGVITDYNNLFGNDTNLAYWDGINITDLTGWRNISGQAANSFNIDPQFLSNTDLHVDEVDMNNTGTPLASVTVDFDGEPRNPITPDIGADEFSPITTNDAGVEAILSPNKGTPFPEGVQPVEIAIKNNGADTLLNVNIEWEANGLPQVTYNWTGFLLPGARDTLTIGSHNFNVGFGNDLLAYTVNPNGMPDNNTSNDTSIVLNLYPALLGNYTIGGSFPDFNSFSTAANSLNNGGILGSVTFDVRNGTYTEQIVLNEINGSNALSPIVFQSENGDSSFVKMEHNNAGNLNYLVRLNGADYVTFSKITFKALGFYSRIFELTNSATNTQIVNCHLIDQANTGSYQLILSSGGFLNNNTRIQYNRFENAGYGVYMIGQGTSQLESGTQILDNVFENQDIYGIYLYYQNASKVERNTITTNSTRNDYNGIYLRYVDNGFTVDKNKIIGGYGFGINLNRCDATLGARGTITNNFIQVGGTAAAYGIYNYYGTFHNFYHNSISVTNTNTNSRAFYNYYGTNKNALNNIFANSGDGFAIYITGNSSLATSNFNDLYTTGLNLGNWDGNVAADLAAWRSISGKDLNSVSANPLYYSDTDLHVLQVALDSAATTISGLTEDIDGDSRSPGYPDIGADEFDYLDDDVGVVAFFAPVDDCDLTNAEQITVVIQNYGGLPKSGFDVAYGLVGGGQTIENVGALSVEPGATANYTFTSPIDLSNYLSFPLEAYTILAGDLNASNDTFQTMIQNYQTPAMVSNMLPASGSINIDPPINFSWLPANGALRYDLYLWEENEAEPNMPLGQDLTQITFAYNNNSLIYGATYKWKVVAKNDFCETEGPIQTFTLRELPDLIVNNVQAPVSPFSGQMIEVSWEIENQAIGNTGSTTWYDYIYLSADNVYQANTDIYLGGFSNLTALGSMMSYSQMKSVTLPQGIEGTYYIFVVTDRNNALIEGNNNNNVSTAASMLVNLTPPPDLVVSSIIVPNTAFSGTPINVIWTVTNQGTGNMPLNNTFYDYLYISDQSTYNPANATYLGRLLNTPIAAGESNTQSRSVTLPQGIFGDYFIHVVADFTNQVYEFAFEANNDRTSDMMNIILTPPPDLVVSNIVSPSTVDNRESVALQWSVFNQGGTSATGGYRDRVYISSHASYDPDSVRNLGSFYTSASVGVGESINRSASVTIPADITGTHYFYVYTDVNNSIFEFNNEDNNITRSDSTVALNADLTIASTSVPATGNSGTDFNVQWTVENQGLGDVLGISRVDKIYLSTDPVYDAQNATELGSLSYNTTMNAGQSISQQKTVQLPNGISGNYYFHILTDATNRVYENLDEGNNIATDSSMILLSPWPDLQIDTLTMLPDTAIAGALLTVEFLVQNHGLGEVTGTIGWQDQIYISPNPVWNINDAVLLKTLNESQAIAPGGTYTGSTSFILPMLGGAANTGICYIYVYTDGLNKIYEYTDENNNTRRSNPIAVTAPEPVDFAVTNATSLPDTLTSGEEVNLQWMVENQGSTTGLWGYPLWYDGIYLREDSTWQPDYDYFVVDFTKQGPVESGESYSNNQMFNIPNGISGDYYAFLVADHTDLTNDINGTNDVWKVRPASSPAGPAMPVHIELSPYPDLEVNTLLAPTTGTAGQPVEVIWTVTNNGPGSTSGSWSDKIYLSTDFDISNNDQIIGNKLQNRILAPGESYTDTLDAIIPISSVGNFVLIFKTDANNSIFELNAEDNNTFFNFLTTSLPLPSDLVIENINFGPMAMVGDQFAVSYTIRNQGTNPATGIMTDLVYFSADEMLDVADVQYFGPENRYIDLAPNATLTTTVTNITPGVPLGDYNIIVQTDILNNIYESSDTNNVLVSTEKVMVTVKELPLGVLTPDTLDNFTSSFYRIEIPDTLIDQTMLVSLDGLTNGGVNELYVSYGAIPTRSIHDYTFSNPFAPDQEIIIPEISAGTYYVLVYGSTTDPSAAGMQTIDMKAEIIPFQVRRVTANKGGNTGSVTLKIEGARFVEDMVMSLVGDSITVIGKDLVYVNSTTVYATFALGSWRYIDNWITEGVPIGFYDVAAEKSTGEFVALVDGFEVIEGLDPSLSISLTHPPNTRVNRVIAMTLNFGNDGNVDIPTPTVSVISQRGAPVALSPEDLALMLEDVFVQFVEEGGPPNVLRPGAIGTVTVYARSSSPLSFKLVQVE